jgi:hypothetical protein
MFVRLFFYVFHFLEKNGKHKKNWRNVIDLVKHTVLILNVLDVLDVALYQRQSGRQRPETGNALVLGVTFEGFEKWRGLRKVCARFGQFNPSYITR